MKNSLISTGKIVNTHGIRGEVRVEPWCDEPGKLCNVDKVYIDNASVKIISARTHKSFVLLLLEGVDSIEKAEKLKGKIIYINRGTIKLENNQFFIEDLIGFTVYNHATDELLDTLNEVLTLPANDVYVIKGEKTYMLPAVKEFIKTTDLENRTMRVSVIPGMCVSEGDDKA